MEGGDHNRGWIREQHEPVRKTKAQNKLRQQKKGLGSYVWRKNKKEGRVRLSTWEKEVILREKSKKAKLLNPQLAFVLSTKEKNLQMGPAGVAQVSTGPGR